MLNLCSDFSGDLADTAGLPLNPLILLALLLLLLAVFFFWRSHFQRVQSGVPDGRIIYSDPQLWGKVEKPFFDADAMLTGKPDYLVKQGDCFIPVEVKSSFSRVEPYGSHVFQLLAYCLLVDRSTGMRPPYGILKYRNRTFAIDYTPAQEEALLDLLTDIRADEGSSYCDRSHNDPARCSRCGFRSICDQKL
ncbi:MAG: hypothetical protein BGO78_13200 [Chloroflexi bacterium 44-23]|nr:MAG: hypothetical protein BGO78_13200 [Chloroflexi bacterium 44-23]